MIYRQTALVLCLILSLCWIFQSCGDGEIEELSLPSGDAYYPMEVGQWVSYQLDTTYYDNFIDSVFTRSYIIKEEITEAFEDNTGRPSVKVNRYLYDSDNNVWNLRDAWFATRDDNQVERVEENLRFIKMVFPIHESTEWQGNSLVNASSEQYSFYNDWQYEYRDIDMPKTINGTNFSNTVTVLQNDFGADNLIQRVYSKEVYAKDIGLVAKELWNLKLEAATLPTLTETPWPDRANLGTLVKMEVIEYGI